MLIEFLRFQYGGRSNQLAATAPRAKPRRACRQQILTQAQRPFASASANCRGDDHRPKTMPAKLIRISDSSNGVKQLNNVTRTVVRTREVKTTGDAVGSPEVPYGGYHPQVVRNYLNQTVPLLTAQQHPRARNRAFCRGNPADRSFADTATVNNRVKSAARDQGGRLHARHGFDVGGYVGERRSSTTCDKSRFLNSHSQSHGVIAESVYKDLCNGTIGWWVRWLRGGWRSQTGQSRDDRFSRRALGPMVHASSFQREHFFPRQGRSPRGLLRRVCGRNPGKICGYNSLNLNRCGHETRNIFKEYHPSVFLLNPFCNYTYNSHVIDNSFYTFVFAATQIFCSSYIYIIYISSNM